MNRRTTLDGYALPPSGAGTTETNAAAFRLPVRRSLAMHPVLAGAVALLVLVALLGFALSRKPVYKASARVYVEPVQTGVLSEATGNYDVGRYESFLQEQMETIERPDILQAAVKSMPAGAWQRPGESVEAAAVRLGAAVKADRVSTSYQLAISANAPSAGVAADAANAVTQAYLAAIRKDTESLSAGRLELLTTERQRIANEMEARRSEQAALGASLGVANPAGVGGDAFDTELQNVRTELAAARQSHDMAEAQLAALHGGGGKQSAGAVATAQEQVAADPAISGMRMTINARRATLIAQMNGMKPANPVFQEDQAELARLDAQLGSMTAGLQGEVEQRTEAKLRQELDRTGALESRLNGEVQRDTAAAASAGPRLQRSGELTADLARLQVRYAAVDDALRGLQLETSGPGVVHLATAAPVPAAPEPSKSRLVLFLALPLALIAGLAAAIVAMRLDGRVYTAADVEEALGFPPVGLLPREGDVSQGCQEEYVLRFAAGLEAAHRNAAVKSFVFTSASADSEIEPAVEAVGAKLRELGFSVAMLKAAEVMRPATHTEPVGAGHEGTALRRLHETGDQVDLILITAFPLLHSAEAEYAVRSADAVILGVESGRTTTHEIRSGAVLLQRLQASGVGALLFGVTQRSADAAYRRSVSIVERRELSGPPAHVAPLREAPGVVRSDRKVEPQTVRAESSESRKTDATPAGDLPATDEPLELYAHEVAERREDLSSPELSVDAAEPVPLANEGYDAGQDKEKALPAEERTPLLHEQPVAAAPAEQMTEMPESVPADAEPAAVQEAEPHPETVFVAEDLPASQPVVPAPQAAMGDLAKLSPFERGPLAPASNGGSVLPIRRRGQVQELKRVYPQEGASGSRRVLSLPPTSFTTRAHNAFRLERPAEDAPQPQRPATEASTTEAEAPAGADNWAQGTRPVDAKPEIARPEIAKQSMRSSPKLWDVRDTDVLDGAAEREAYLAAGEREHAGPVRVERVRAQRGAARQWAALSRFAQPEPQRERGPEQEDATAGEQRGSAHG